MRIIAGCAKGRVLKTPKGMLTRPTLDRTRESLFNILENFGFENVPVLDIFAGTGALGLEAISRGAASGVFIDHYTRRLIEENAALCGFSDRCSVLGMEMDKALARLQGQSFFYIFADPPYDKGFVNQTLDNIMKYGLLRPQGLILMEHSSKEQIKENPSFSVIREKTYGKETRISFISHTRKGVGV